MEKWPKKQPVNTVTITFHNGDLINADLENTSKILGVLKPKYPLHYFL